MQKEELYPKDFQEFLTQFKNEDDCWGYIFQMRWSDGYICSKCKSSKYWLTQEKIIHCSSCGYETAVTRGTIFHKTRKPLLLWFHIMWWVWLQKLRRAMVRTERDKLRGEVEVDEAYIGGREIGVGKQGRGAETKVLVVVATECKGKQIGRVRFQCIPDSTTESLSQFVEANIEKGSTVITDGWTGYGFLAQSKNYKYEQKVISGSGKEAHELLPHVHMVDSLVKRWINGTHQGNISPKHLPYYLDEFAFRFNRKLSTYRGKLFYRLMQQAVETPPTPLKDIIKNKKQLVLSR